MSSFHFDTGKQRSISNAIQPMQNCTVYVDIYVGVGSRLYPIGLRVCVCVRVRENARAFLLGHISTHILFCLPTLFGLLIDGMCVHISTYLFTDENCWYHLYLCLERQLHKAYCMYMYYCSTYTWDETKHCTRTFYASHDKRKYDQKGMKQHRKHTHGHTSTRRWCLHSPAGRHRSRDENNGEKSHQHKMKIDS